jgi:hypothetical protein
MVPALTLKAADWGPAAWTFLHSIAFAYPDAPTKEQRRHTMAFFESLPWVLPCGSCAEHFRDIIAETKREGVWRRTFTSRDTLASWLHGVHNKVNKRIGKPVVSFNKVMETYCDKSSMGAACPIYARPAVTALGFSFCEVRPAALRIAVGAIVAAIILGLTVATEHYRRIATVCRKQCPKLKV